MFFSNYTTRGFCLTLYASTRATLERYIYIYINIYHISCIFMMFPSHLLPHQPTHIHPERNPQRGGGGAKRRPPFVEAARSAASFMDGCVGAGEAADAAETHVNVRNTCTCMHALRATSDPHGHHGWPMQNKM